MARLEWVRHRLENWARWCQQQDAGGLGYPKQTAFARLGGKGSRAEAVIPTDSLEASETDQAVKSLQGLHSELHRVLTLTYAQGLPRHLVARKMAVTERTVHANLERADYMLARWFDERRALRAQARVTYAASHP